MIDFSKLLNRTPEEQAQAQLEIEARDRVVIQRFRDLAITRSDQILRLYEGNFSLGVFDTDFVRSMHIKSTRRDEFGQMGGALSTLTEKQGAHFERLVAAHLKDAKPQIDCADKLGDSCEPAARRFRP